MKLNALTTPAQVAAFLADTQPVTFSVLSTKLDPPRLPHPTHFFTMPKKKAGEQNDFFPHAPLRSFSSLFEVCT